MFVLAVFLLAYGIARFAILSPMNDSTVRAVTAIFSVPYKQMYADSLDEIVMKGRLDKSKTYPVKYYSFSFMFRYANLFSFI